MKRADFIAFVILGIFILCLQAIANAQCCDFKLVRKDTVLREGIFTIEPPPGYQAEVKFVLIPATVVDSHAAAHVGSWVKAVNTVDPYHLNTVSYSNTAGDYLTYNFYGSRITIYSSLAPNHGRIAIAVNGGAETERTLYAAARADRQKIFTAEVPTGTNSIKVRVTGTKDAAATGTHVVIDYFEIY